MPLPDAVDHDSRGQRMTGLREPFGELQSPAAHERRLGVVTRENHWEAFRRDLAGVVVIASDEYFLLDRVAVFDRAGHLGFFGRGFLQLRLLFMKRGESRPLFRRESFVVFTAQVKRPAREIDVVEEAVIARLEFGFVGKRFVFGQSYSIFGAPLANLLSPFGEAFLESILITPRGRGELVG